MSDMNKIHKLIEEFPEQIRQAYQLEVPKIKNSFNRVSIVGMGGSYISGLLIKSVFEEKIKMPIEVSHGFNLIQDSKTLYVLISYNGNTKEVIQAFNKLKKNNLFVVTSGGKLLELSRKYKKQYVKIPSGLHSRYNIGYCFMPVIRALVNSGYAKSLKRFDANRIQRILSKEKKKLEIEAAKLAFELGDRTALFYATDYFYAAAYKLQTTIEEDVKLISHANHISELFHNELEALPNSEFLPILIIDKRDLIGLENQMRFFKSYIDKYYELGFDRYSREERMFLFFQFANFLGYHLAKLKQSEIGTTPNSDEIKKK